MLYFISVALFITTRYLGGIIFNLGHKWTDYLMMIFIGISSIFLGKCSAGECIYSHNEFRISEENQARGCDDLTPAQKAEAEQYFKIFMEKGEYWYKKAEDLAYNSPHVIKRDCAIAAFVSAMAYISPNEPRVKAIVTILALITQCGVRFIGNHFNTNEIEECLKKSDQNYRIAEYWERILTNKDWFWIEDPWEDEDNISFNLSPSI